MPRNWPRDKQRKYREARRKQAALVADRLLGKKKTAWAEHDDRVDVAASSMRLATNLYVSNPRTGFIISGIEGV